MNISAKQKSHNPKKKPKKLNIHESKSSTKKHFIMIWGFVGWEKSFFMLEATFKGQSPTEHIKL